MDKKELKSDIIREKIANVILYLKDNSKRTFYVFIFFVLAISLYIYLNNSKKVELNQKNQELSIKIDRMIELRGSSETFKLVEDGDTISIALGDLRRDAFIQDSIDSIINSMPDTDIRTILLISSKLKSADLTKLQNVLESYPIENENSKMLIYIREYAKSLIENNSKTKISLLKESIELAPSYDLKVYSSIDLMELYLQLDNSDAAKNIILECYDYYDNLSNVAKNELDYSKGKIKMINK